MSKTQTHRKGYDREAILARLMAKETPAPVVKPKRAPRKVDGTLSWNQAITVKACADALGDEFAWDGKPEKGRYFVKLNGERLTPDEASTIIGAWLSRKR